jgi:hypothetical protein
MDYIKKQKPLLSPNVKMQDPTPLPPISNNKSGDVSLNFNKNIIVVIPFSGVAFHLDKTYEYGDVSQFPLSPQPLDS